MSQSITLPLVIESKYAIGGSISITLTENGISYDDGLSKPSVEYSQIVKIASSESFNSNTYASRNVILAYKGQLSIIPQNGTPISFNPLLFDKDDLVQLIDIAVSKNPNILLDENVSALKAGNLKPFQNSALRGVLVVLLFGLSIFTVSLFIARPPYKPLLSLQHVDATTFVMLGSLGIFYVLIIVGLMRSSKKRVL
jgi:hypothetical protein